DFAKKTRRFSASLRCDLKHVKNAETLTMQKFFDQDVRETTLSALAIDFCQIVSNRFQTIFTRDLNVRVSFLFRNFETISHDPLVPRKQLIPHTKRNNL